MNLIKAWKENWLPWCKVSDEMKEVAGKIKRINMLYWDEYAEKFDDCSDGEFLGGSIYRLPEDFQCPHTDTTGIPIYGGLPKITDRKCLWCGEEVPDEPKMGWVEYPIKKLSTEEYAAECPVGYRFTNPFIDALPRCVGFGGVKYKSPKSEQECFWYMTPPMAMDGAGPWIPVAVRFWEAMK